MSNLVIGFRGRLNRVSPVRVDVGSIQAAARDGQELEGKVARILTKIKDWFCGTHEGEVKRCLYDLCSSDTSDKKKVESFKRLRSLAGASYQHDFSVENTHDKRIFRVGDFKLEYERFDVDPSLIAQELQDTVNRVAAGTPPKHKFSVDFPRGCPNGEYLYNGRRVESEEQYRSLIGEKAPMVFAICNQTGLTDVVKDIWSSSRNGHLVAPIAGMSNANALKKLYNVTQNDDGSVAINIGMISDAAFVAETEEHYGTFKASIENGEGAKSFTLDLDLVIGSDNQVSVTKYDAWGSLGFAVLTEAEQPNAAN